MNRKLLILLLFSGLIFSQFVMGQFGQFIQPESPPESFLSCTPVDSLRVCLYKIFFDVMKVLLVVAIILAAVLVVWAGLTYIFGGGDQESTKKAKGRIIYAAIGLVTAFLAWAAVLILSRILEVGGRGV